MKKTAILLSALITGALAASTVAQAKNDYPVFRFWAEGIPYSELSDEEKLEYAEELEVWRAKLTEGYVSGEFDFDFNLDTVGFGVVDDVFDFLGEGGIGEAKSEGIAHLFRVIPALAAAEGAGFAIGVALP